MEGLGLEPIVKLGVATLQAQVEATHLHCKALLIEFEEAESSDKRASVVRRYARAARKLHVFEKLLRELEQEAGQA
jgi:hypothetical protein